MSARCVRLGEMARKAGAQASCWLKPAFCARALGGLGRVKLQERPNLGPLAYLTSNEPGPKIPL